MRKKAPTEVAEANPYVNEMTVQRYEFSQTSAPTMKFPVPLFPYSAPLALSYM